MRPISGLALRADLYSNGSIERELDRPDRRRPRWLSILDALTARDGGISVVGETADGASAVTAARDLRPDLVLLDEMLPDTSGFEVARRLSTLPHPPIVVLVSSREASDYGDVIGHCATAGFISKLEPTGPALRDVIGAES